MHQLAILSTGWVAFFHSVLNGVHCNPFLFTTDHYFFFLFGFIFCCFFFRLDFTHSYLFHLPTLINIVPTLVPYKLSITDITTLISSYPTDLTTILTTYLTNLTTLLTTYLTNLIIVLITYFTDLATLLFSNLKCTITLLT